MTSLVKNWGYPNELGNPHIPTYWMVNGLSSTTSYSITSHLDTGYLINLDHHQITSHVIKLSFLWLVIIPKQTQFFWYPPRRSVYSETRHPIVPRDAPGFWKRVKIMGTLWVPKKGKNTEKNIGNLNP